MKNENKLTISANGGFILTAWTPGGNCFGQFDEVFVFKTFDDFRDFIEKKMLQEMNKEPLKVA